MLNATLDSTREHQSKANAGRASSTAGSEKNRAAWRGDEESGRGTVAGAEGAMRQGFRVIDSDTHVNPSLDVLLRYADKDLQQRLDDLQPYRRTVKTVAGRGDAEDVGSATILSVKPVRLQRVAGAK